MAKERKRIPGKEFYNYKKKHGDRTDGWRVDPQDPTFLIIPHIMAERCDAQVYFSDELDTTALDEFVRRVRRDESLEMPELSRLTIIMAAAVRTFARYPKLNRFIGGKRVYARNHMCVSLTMKKSMSIESDEANLKMHFNPDATLKDTYDELIGKITASKNDIDNGTDNLVDKIHSIPQWAIRLFMRWIHYRDNHRGLPKAIYDFSPFHTSIYITDIGSTGIGSIYHHIYNTGTTSMFLSIGRREKKLVLDDEGKPKYINILRLNYVIDERICDGFYYAKAVRYLTSLLRNPDKLLAPPEVINEDPLH